MIFFHQRNLKALINICEIWIEEVVKKCEKLSFFSTPWNEIKWYMKGSWEEEGKIRRFTDKKKSVCADEKSSVTKIGKMDLASY